MLVVWTVMFVYILFHICIWSMIYIIVPNLSYFGVSSQVGKGYYQQITLLKVDVLSSGQTLAVSYSHNQLRGQPLPSDFLRTIAWKAALMQLELSTSVSGRVWRGNHGLQNLAQDLFKWSSSCWTTGKGERGKKERECLPILGFSCRTKSLKPHKQNK